MTQPATGTLLKPAEVAGPCPQPSGLRTRVGFCSEGQGVGVEEEARVLTGVP